MADDNINDNEGNQPLPQPPIDLDAQLEAEQPAAIASAAFMVSIAAALSILCNSIWPQMTKVLMSCFLAIVVKGFSLGTLSLPREAFDPLISADDQKFFLCMVMLIVAGIGSLKWLGTGRATIACRWVVVGLKYIGVTWIGLGIVRWMVEVYYA